jgi:cytochrome c-type biogenesis protein CcmH
MTGRRARRRRRARIGSGAVLGAFLALGGIACAAADSAASIGTNTGLDDNGQMQDAALQERFEHITKELRCLVCQNESIADSNVELARDLRRQVRDMLMAHQSDEAIYKFMTDRYGEFVRFAPPLEPKTLLIWGAPFALVLFGGFVIIRVARQRAHMPLDE